MPSRMICSMQVENPRHVVFSMSLTMSLEDWILLSRQLETSESSVSWPTSEIRSSIGDLVSQAQTLLQVKEETNA